MLELASIWNRIHWESWHHDLPMIGFACFFFAFLVVVIKSLRMKKDKVDHLANLPFEEPPSQNHSDHDAK